jgi:hypothetical protein
MSASSMRVLGLFVAFGGLAVGCSGAKKIQVGVSCILNSDCNQPLVCTMGKCHEGCRATVDCPAGQTCTKVDNSGVCQLPGEVQCAVSLPCGPLLICAVDLRCRSGCNGSADCMGGQVCVYNVCAETNELENGQLPQKTAATSDAGTYDVLSLVAAGPEAGVDAASESEADTRPDLPASPPDAPVAPICGILGVTCCAGSACNAPDIACSQTLGICVRCGIAVDLPCCAGDPCAVSGTVCAAGICKTCGGVNQPCCRDNACTGASSVCASGSCVACGGPGQPCCDGAKCSSLNAACESGVCCGSAGGPCCAGGACRDTLSACSAGTCVTCTAPGSPCCAGGDAGDYCFPAGHMCIAGTCDWCGVVNGGLNQPCCRGDLCLVGVCSAGTCQR